MNRILGGEHVFISYDSFSFNDDWKDEVRSGISAFVATGALNKSAKYQRESKIKSLFSSNVQCGKVTWLSVRITWKTLGNKTYEFNQINYLF